jgi:hypothetical protein
MALPALAAQFLLGEAMDRMGANKDLKGFVMGPKGFMIDKLKGAVDEVAGVAPGTTNLATNLVTNPKGVLIDTARNYAQERFNDAISDRPAARDFIPFESSDDSGMSFGEGEYKRGGQVKRKSAFKQPKASSASRRGDGIAQRGKTKGRYV